MGLLARIRLLVPLIIIVAIIAAIIYLVVSWRRSPTRAKEVLIAVFTWFTSIISGFSVLVALYSLLDGNESVLDLALGFLVIFLIGLGITRLCHYRFVKNHPNYKDKRTGKAEVIHRWPWDAFFRR